MVGGGWIARLQKSISPASQKIFVVVIRYSSSALSTRVTIILDRLITKSFSAPA